MSPQSRYTLLQPDDEVESSGWRPRWQKRSWSDIRGSWSFIHPVLLYLTIFILLKNHYGSGNLTTRTSGDPSQLIYSPAQSAIDYEVEVFPENLWNKTPYMTTEDGFPSNETDELWDELYKYGIVEVSAEEAMILPNATAEMPHKPDSYVVEIDVFHQLHCLNYVRKALYPDRYMKHFRDAYDDDGNRNYTGHDARHYDHCVDSLRQAIMCNADVSTIPWRFDPTKGFPAPRLEVVHTCRNFNAILDWARDRAIPDDDYSLEWSPGSEADFKSLGGDFLRPTQTR